MTIESFIFDARSIVTVVSFITFIGIVWWAYGAHRSGDFDAAARLPFADETDTQGMEKRHG